VETLDTLNGPGRLTELNIGNTYGRIQIKKGKIGTAACQTHCAKFEDSDIQIG
jgi:hypothetical protein